MGYICPKNTFLQLKHYTQRIYPTLLSTTSGKIYQMTDIIFENKSFFTTQPLYIFFSSNITYFLQKQPIKVQIFRQPLLTLEFTKFFMSFLKPRVSFSSNFASLFSFMRHNSSVLFHLNICILWTNGSNQSANFWTFNCSHKN